MNKEKSLCITKPQLCKYIYNAFRNSGESPEVIIIRRSNIRQIVNRIRDRTISKTYILVYDKDLVRDRTLIEGLLFLSRSKEKLILDVFGCSEKLNWSTYLNEFLKIIPELILSAAIIIYSYLIMEQMFLIKKLKINAVRKIAYLRTDHWFGIEAGGSVGHISGVVNAFHELDYNVFILSTDKLLLIDPKHTPIIVIKPSYSFFSNLPEIPELAYNFKLIKEARSIFQRNAPDLIYQRYSLNNYSGIILSKEFNIPLVIEYNGSFVWMEKNWGGSLMFRRLVNKIEIANLHSADLVVVVSEVMKEELKERGIEERKILINPNGVDAERYCPDIEASNVKRQYDIKGKIIIGFMGTFGPWHGAEILADAIKFVVQRENNVHFMLIGDGMTRPKSEEIVQRDRITEFVTFTGIVPQEEGPKYLAACDILVSPHIPNLDGTPFFGSPTKLFEYMAMGKGIVASDLEQIGQILENGHDAILVKPGDANELAEGILKLIENRALREELGMNARKKVLEKYTWEKNVARVIEALERTTHENRD